MTLFQENPEVVIMIIFVVSLAIFIQCIRLCTRTQPEVVYHDNGVPNTIIQFSSNSNEDIQ
jgi:hypothetical protein